jgi:steroid delta-isomerase-like uncharacterized protein
VSEKNKALIRRMKYEAFYKRNLRALDKLMADDFVDHNPLPGDPHDLEGYKRGITAIRTAFPDLSLTSHTLMAEGDRVIQSWTVVGTHRGDFLGVAPSGKRVTFTGMEIWRFGQNGKIAERWAAIDRLDMFLKAGIASEPGLQSDHDGSHAPRLAASRAPAARAAG